LRFKRPYFTGTLHYLLYIPYDLLADADFRRMAESIFSQGRGGGLVRARVAAINAEFGPNGATPMLTRDLTAEEIEALANHVTRRHFALALSTNHGLSKEQVNLLSATHGPTFRRHRPGDPPAAQLSPNWCAPAHPAAGSGNSGKVLLPIEVVEILMPGSSTRTCWGWTAGSAVPRPWRSTAPHGRLGQRVRPAPDRWPGCHDGSTAAGRGCGRMTRC
jgi:hypothetical protein